MCALQVGGRQLPDRDFEVLRWIGRNGIVTSEQVARAWFPGTGGQPSLDMAWRRLRILQEHRLIERVASSKLQNGRTLWRGPLVVRATNRGLREVELPLPVAAIVPHQITHQLGITDLLDELLLAHHFQTYYTEREVRALRTRERSGGRRPPGRGRMPDAVICLADGTTVGIELDLTDKGVWRYRPLVTQYLSEMFQGKLLDRVWWFLPTQGAVDRMQPVLARAGAGTIITPRLWQR
ncbi:MAG: replication-relaxation family protein [Chloroflexota bacterium]